MKTTVVEIIRTWLADNGCDGLYNERGGCSCLIDDLGSCCENPLDCLPGHKTPCQCGDGHVYDIVGEVGEPHGVEDAPQQTGRSPIENREIPAGSPIYDSSWNIVGHVAVPVQYLSISIPLPTENSRNDSVDLDAAIDHAEKVANSYKDTAPDCDCAREHRRLAAWLRELKELRG